MGICFLPVKPTRAASSLRGGNNATAGQRRVGSHHAGAIKTADMPDTGFLQAGNQIISRALPTRTDVFELGSGDQCHADQSDRRQRHVIDAGGEIRLGSANHHAGHVVVGDEMRGQLRDALRSQRQEQAAKAYVENMFNSASLTIDGKVLNQVIEAEK